MKCLSRIGRPWPLFSSCSVERFAWGSTVRPGLLLLFVLVFIPGLGPRSAAARVIVIRSADFAQPQPVEIGSREVEIPRKKPVEFPPPPRFMDAGRTVFCYQDLDPAELFREEDFPTQEGQNAEDYHPGLTLSAWVRVGTDAEFDELLALPAAETERVVRNNRLAVIFEQFGLTGEPRPERACRFGFLVDLFGRVESITDPSYLPCQAGPVRRQAVGRRCEDGRIAHCWRDGRTPTAGTPRAADLQRWVRGYAVLVPRFTDEEFSAADEDQRYIVHINPWPADEAGGIRLTHAVDGLMLERSRAAAPWTADKTLVIGPSEERDEAGRIRLAPEPLNAEIPYRSR